MENSKPDVLQDGPLDEQRQRNEAEKDANSSSGSETSASEDNRSEADKYETSNVPADPPLYPSRKNFFSRPVMGTVSHHSSERVGLLRPSLFSGGQADAGSASSPFVFGARPNAFSGASKDQISGGGPSKPFLLRPSKLAATASEQSEGTDSTSSDSYVFGAKSAAFSDLSKDSATGTSSYKAIFLRPSKLAGAAPEDAIDLTPGHSDTTVETKTDGSPDSQSNAGADNSSTKPAIRPSQLAATTADLQISEKATPPKNPFARITASFEDRGEKEAKSTAEHSENIKMQEIVTSSTSLPKFVRLSPGSSVVNPVFSVATAPPSFVFGENLLDRIQAKENTAAGQQHLDSNGASSSEMLFTSVVRKEDSNDGNSNESSEKPSKSLSDAAREYEESRAAKRKYEEVAVVTGEEDEANVVQMNCKLHAFEKLKGTWVERGRGTLRLNDRESARGVQSRVVVRTAGNLRVVINTKVWAGMVVERASAKSVRLTAMDTSGDVKVFLVSGSQKETEQLYKSLVARVERQRAAAATSAVPADADAPLANPEPKRIAQDAGGDDTDTGEAGAFL